MAQDSFDSHWIKRTKWLTQALLFSGSLNIAFLATFAYFALKERKTPVPIELKTVANPSSVLSNEQVLRAYSNLSFQDLLLRLDNKETIELGFLKRDLALACLTAFHHFNLEKAIGGLQIQRRKVLFSSQDRQESIELELYPGLADYQFQGIIHYAKTEKWPFTSQGLFFELKRSQGPKDPSLLEAFYLTPEFHTAFTLFSRSGPPLEKEVLVDLLLEGKWETLCEFVERQRVAQDLSVERKNAFLLSYLSCNSKIAAKILLENEREFILKRLEDAQILDLYGLLPQISLETLAKELLLSPRSDAVLKKSAQILYTLVSEPLPEPFDLKIAQRRFVPEKIVQEALPIAPPVTPKVIEPVASKETKKSKRKHIVQEGENLWKISRKYKVSIESIMKVNKLETERLRPGKELEIPN